MSILKKNRALKEEKMPSFKGVQKSSQLARTYPGETMGYPPKTLEPVKPKGLKVTKIDRRHLGHAYVEFQGGAHVILQRGEYPNSLKVGDYFEPQSVAPRTLRVMAVSPIGYGHNEITL